MQHKINNKLFIGIRAGSGKSLRNSLSEIPQRLPETQHILGNLI